MYLTTITSNVPSRNQLTAEITEKHVFVINTQKAVIGWALMRRLDFMPD